MVGGSSIALGSSCCAAVILALTTRCTVYKREVVIPNDDAPTAMVLSFTLMHPLDKIARHAWFAVRAKGETRWFAKQ